jgi:hypothetical protein
MPTPPASNIFIAGQSLPVKLLSFNATAQDKHVLVEWSATNEINSKQYIVERSADGETFLQLQQLTTKEIQEPLTITQLQIINLLLVRVIIV